MATHIVPKRGGTTVPSTPSASCAPLIVALSRIVLETMAYPPQRPNSTSSYLPPELVEQAQHALGQYGARVTPTQASEGRA